MSEHSQYTWSYTPLNAFGIKNIYISIDGEIVKVRCVKNTLCVYRYVPLFTVRVDQMCFVTGSEQAGTVYGGHNPPDPV